MTKKLFYLHIPKTAGTTFNYFLERLVEKELCLSHIESHPELSNFNQSQALMSKKIISGHIAYKRAKKIIHNFDEFKKVTIFREPYQQLSSHLRYVKKLSLPSESERLSVHTDNIKKIVNFIRDVNFNNVKEIETFIQWLVEEDLVLFHNIQTQYLVSNRFSESPNILDEAKKTLDDFNYVGISERIVELMAMLSYLEINKSIVMDMKLNENDKLFQLNIENEDIKEAFFPLIKYDLEVYNYARERFINDFHMFCSSLEKESKSIEFSTVDLETLKRM